MDGLGNPFAKFIFMYIFCFKAGKKEVYTSERVREILFAWVILTLAIMREQQQTLLIQV